MGVERRATVMHPHPKDDDEPAVTCAELGLLVRRAIEQLCPEVAGAILLLHDLLKLAEEFEARGDAVCQPGSSAGDVLAVMACHLPCDVRAIAENLRGICELLKLAATVDDEL
jgi:hypothetical protein